MIWPPFQHRNALGVADGGQPVGDDKDGAVLHQRIHALQR